MQEVFIKLIEQLNGAVFTLVAIVVVSFWAIFKIGGLVQTFGLFKEKNSDLDKDVSTIKDSLSSIKATADLLYQAHLSTVRSKSPLSLTDKGSDISKILTLEKKVSDHWGSIKKAINQKKPSNPYDIQVVSLELAQKFFDLVFSDEERNEIKTYAYNSGTNLLEIYPIIGVISRDKYLEEKGLSATEVDKHAPR